VLSGKNEKNQRKNAIYNDNKKEEKKIEITNITIEKNNNENDLVVIIHEKLDV
jgi:hypothetical protein